VRRVPAWLPKPTRLAVAATVAIILTRIRATAGHPDRIGANI